MQNYYLENLNVAGSETIRDSEYALFPIDLSWTLGYSMGQDAEYIIRKKALKFALAELKNVTLVADNLKADKDVDTINSEHNYINKKQGSKMQDLSWIMDCPAIMQ